MFVRLFVVAVSGFTTNTFVLSAGEKLRAVMPFAAAACWNRGKT